MIFTPSKIAICSGETSGDEHAAALVSALRALNPSIQVRGMGGRHSRAAGVETLVDSETAASTMGLFEILSQLGELRTALNSMKKLLKDWKPDLLIVIDFPDFNFMLSRYAKKLGIKVLYFIIPKMWAWRSGRIEHFKKYIDHAATIFPFERDFCEKRGYHNVTYVGHPFADQFKKLPVINREKFLSDLGMRSECPVVALLPGSRRGELKRHLAPLLSGFAILKNRHASIQGIIPLPSAERAAEVQTQIPEALRDCIKVISGQSIDVMRIADIGFVKSGTSNLQASFCELPFVMFYLLARSSVFVIKRFIPTKVYSILNILRPNTVTELVQAGTLEEFIYGNETVSPGRIADALEQLLISEENREAMRKKLRAVNVMLEGFDTFPGCTADMTAYDRAAIVALSHLIGSDPTQH